MFFGMFERYGVHDKIADEVLPEGFFFKSSAEDLKWTIEFLYVIDAIKAGETLTPEDVDKIDKSIEVIRL